MNRLLNRLRFVLDHRWVPRHSSDYLDGDLADGDDARARHHLGECPECRALVDGLHAIIGALGSLGDEPADPAAEAVLASLQGQLVVVPIENA